MSEGILVTHIWEGIVGGAPDNILCPVSIMVSASGSQPEDRSPILLLGTSALVISAE